MKKTRAPLAEVQTQKLDIVMFLVADELDPAMNPEEILLVIETEIIPVVNIRMTAAVKRVLARARSESRREGFGKQSSKTRPTKNMVLPAGAWGSDDDGHRPGAHDTSCATAPTSQADVRSSAHSG